MIDTRFLRLSSIALLQAVILLACGKTSPDEDADVTASPRVPVRTAPVTRGDLSVIVRATGRTVALRQEKVFAPVAGRIAEFRAFEGAAFRRGEVMAVVRTRESQAILSGAERLLQMAQTPQQKEEAQKALAAARASQSTVELRAKFDGVVSSRTTADGELVAENAELFTLVDLSSLVFVADVPLADMSSLRTGQRADVRFSMIPQVRFPAIVDAANPQTDLQSQTVKVRLRFRSLPSRDRGLLRTDVMGTAHIVTGERRNVLLVPRSALLRDDQNDTYTVLIVTPDSLALSLPVAPGLMNDSVAELRGSGIGEGQSVIIEGNYALADSTKVALTGTAAP